MNKIILHIEGFAVLTLSVYFYWAIQSSWLLFILLLFVPDLSMLGYLASPKVGAISYNIFHTYSLPIIVIFSGLFFVNAIVLSIGLIWLAHIGMDRMLGYGLKYPTHFKDTHFNRV